MNQHMILAATLILLVPGCWGRKQTSVVDVEAGSMTSGYQKSNKKSLFDEDVEGFVLEEGSDPFAGAEDNGMMFVEAGQDSAMPDARTSQAAYGLRTVYFDFDKYDLRDDQTEILDHDIQAVKNAINKGMIVVVEGHADRAAGSAHYNMQLSHKRAENVANYFTERGVPANRLKAVGRGFEMPIVPTGTIEQQAPNRRVELYTIQATQQ